MSCRRINSERLMKWTKANTRSQVAPAFCAICECILMVNRFVSCCPRFRATYTLQMFHSVILLWHNLTGKHNKSFNSTFCMLFFSVREHQDEKPIKRKQQQTSYYIQITRCAATFGVHCVLAVYIAVLNKWGLHCLYPHYTHLN